MALFHRDFHMPRPALKACCLCSGALPSRLEFQMICRRPWNRIRYLKAGRITLRYLPKIAKSNANALGSVRDAVDAN